MTVREDDLAGTFAKPLPTNHNMFLIRISAPRETFRIEREHIGA